MKQNIFLSKQIIYLTNFIYLRFILLSYSIVNATKWKLLYMLMFVMVYFLSFCYLGDPLLCQPYDNGELPFINYATKPVLVSNETYGLRAELPATPVQSHNTEGLAELTEG